MTSIETIIQKCAICGGKSERIVLVSWNAFGYQDLDTRQLPPLRSLIDGQTEDILQP